MVEPMIEIDRQYLGLMMEAGYILLGMQRFKEAKEVFEGISVMAPESDAPVVALGSVEFCRGKFADAIKRYNEALAIDPESAYAKAYMGEALFFMGKKEAAITMLEGVNRDDPSGKAGDFARALLDAIRKGFDPQMLSGHEEIKDYERKKAKSRKAH